MLSVRKVKLHGMQDSRWSPQNKITQYKGLINLFTRDRKILQADTAVANKRQKNYLRSLTRDAVIDREKLDNAIGGDRQQIRNVLQDHKHLQLAYQELQAVQIIDHINQQNFILRKTLDRLHDKMRGRIETLVRAKLTLAQLEDRIKYEPPGTSPLEIAQKKVTAQIRDTILKQTAAICCRNIYTKMLYIMEKDAKYFDAILDALKVDTKLQGKCMYRTVELGQLATEYLDNRKCEFQTLQKMVKSDMAERDEDVTRTTAEVNERFRNFKFSLRKDSDFTLLIHVPNPNIDVQEDLEDITRTLDQLKNSFHVTSYYVLNDCLQEQDHQAKRLMELKDTYVNGRNTLENRINHAVLMHDFLENTVVDSTFEYMREKQSLKKEIQTKIAEISEYRQEFNRLATLMAKIRSTLQHLEQYCKIIKGPGEFLKCTMKRHCSAQDMLDFMGSKKDSMEIIDILAFKLRVLSVNTVPFANNYERESARIQIQELVAKRTMAISINETKSATSLVMDVIVEDYQVPNRAEIKLRSKQIVLANTKTDD